MVCEEQSRASLVVPIDFHLNTCYHGHMLVKVGITATRKGMSEMQKTTFARELKWLVEQGHTIEFHHGDCIGGDSEADMIVRNIGNSVVHIHPPVNPKYRAFCAQEGDTVYGMRPYVDRDHDIVNAVDLMYAGPKDHELEERRGSGTWTSIRYARERMAEGKGPRKLRILERD